MNPRALAVIIVSLTVFPCLAGCGRETPRPEPLAQAALRVKPSPTIRKATPRPTVMDQAYIDGRLEQTLEPIYFDAESSVLSPDALDRLSLIAALLRSLPPVQIAVEGHADEDGSVQHNMDLAADRAMAAKSRLVALGVDGSHLKIISFGKERPFQNCSMNDETCRWRNRCVEWAVTAR